MKRKRRIVIPLILLVAVLGPFVVSDIRWARVTDPTGKFDTWDGFVAHFGQPARVTHVERGGETSRVAFSRVNAWLALPSGPPAYVFDSHGRLIDWTSDSGDNTRFEKRWLRSTGVTPASRPASSP